MNRLLFILLFLTINKLSFAQVIKYSLHSQTQQIGKDIFYFEDKEGTLGIKDILKPEIQNQFQQNTTDVFAQPATSSAFWFKFTVKNNSPKDLWLDINTSYAWYVDFYAPDEDGNYKDVQLTGILRGESSKLYASNTIWLPLNKANDNDAETYYFRLETEMPMELPLIVGTIEQLHKNKNLNDFIIAGFWGLMLIMLLYNLFLFFSIKDKLYLYYLGYLLTYILIISHVNNYSLFNYFYGVEYWYEKCLVWQAPNFIFVILFGIGYLNLKKKAVWLYRILVTELIFILLLGASNLFVSLIYIVNLYQIMVTVIYLTLLFAGWWMLFKGSVAAHYYAFGWTVLMLTIIIFLATINGWLDFNVFTRNAVIFGVGLEACLFSLALADRFNSLRRESIVVQQALLVKTRDELQAQKNLLEKQQKIDHLTLKQREAEIFLEQREILRSSIDNLPLFIALADNKGKYLVVNQLYETTFNLPIDEIEGKFYWEILPEELLEKHGELIKRALTGEQNITFHHPFSENFYAYGEYTPFFDANGNVKYVSVYVSNIYSLKQKELELEKLNTTKDKLFSIIAHDLRSPLTTLSTMISLFEDGTLSEKDLRNLMKEMSSSMNHTTELVDNLLVWAREQLKGQKIKTQKINLIPLIDQNLTLYKKTALKKDIQLEKEASTATMNQAIAFADKNMIDTVIRNLISNAIKYTPRGGKISIRLSRTRNHVKVEIIDNGIGIAKERLEQVFNGFTTSTKGTNQEKGTGLGLMICKEFIEKNRGEIEVKSTTGVGTTFYFILPAPLLHSNTITT